METFLDEWGAYKTKAGGRPPLFPGIYFYRRALGVVFRASRLSRLGLYDDRRWFEDSLGMMRFLEGAGVAIEIKGVRNIEKAEGPCVFVANHMSTLETFVLPSIILPFRKVTFVVKKELVEYPVFGHIMRSRDPVVVGRKNPREDLKAVLEGGAERLKAGTSIIIFPQTTRSASFDQAGFNSMGVKLARKAGAPVLPIAIKTDAWGVGRLLKDLGKIDPKKPVRFSFGDPIEVSGRGTGEHEALVGFIAKELSSWGVQVTGRP